MQPHQLPFPLWDDPTFDGNRARMYQRTPQQQRADAHYVRRAQRSWHELRNLVAYEQHQQCARCLHEI